MCDRLKAIEARVKALGWDWHEPVEIGPAPEVIEYNISKGKLRNRVDIVWRTENRYIGTEYDIGLTAAERLLAQYEMEKEFKERKEYYKSDKDEYIKAHGLLAYWRRQADIHKHNATIYPHAPTAERLKIMSEVFQFCADDFAALYEEGVVVEIRHGIDRDGKTLCSKLCTFANLGAESDEAEECGLGAGIWEPRNKHRHGISYKEMCPGPDCPGPKKFKLVPWEEVE